MKKIFNHIGMVLSVALLGLAAACTPKEINELAEKIFEAMNPDEVYETKAIGGLVPELAEASTQKLTALMKILVASERVVPEKVKGKATYHLA